MELKVSSDPKIVKMYRRLEKFLDQEEMTGSRSITFINAETGRNFATFISPESFEAFLRERAEMQEALREAHGLLSEAAKQIEFLEDDNAMLDLIDLQNEVIQGRAIMDEAPITPAVHDNVNWTLTENLVAANSGYIHPFTSDVAGRRGL